jgi:hypothetical protein
MAVINDCIDANRLLVYSASSRVPAAERSTAELLELL